VSRISDYARLARVSEYSLWSMEKFDNTRYFLCQIKISWRCEVLRFREVEVG